MFTNNSNPNEDNYHTLVRSRSSEDLTRAKKSFELQSFNYEQKTCFLRQGAFRKRTVGWSENIRSSAHSLLTNDTIDHNVLQEQLKFERPSEAVGISTKYQKHSIAKFSAVKDFWRSLRNDINDREIENQRNRHNSDHFLRRNRVREHNRSNITGVINKIAISKANIRDPPNWITECSWTDIVDMGEDFTKKSCDLQASIWELIETEVSCLNFLSTTVEVFQPVLLELQAIYDELSTVNTLRLFGNIDEVYRSNFQLWQTCISLPLQQSISNHGPLNVLLMKNGFLSISTIMIAYKMFMQAQPGMSKYYRELEKSNSVFKEYLMWTRSYSKSNRDGVLSILSVPLQRITKYKILLERIKCFTDEEQSNHVNEMISSVHEFLTYINSIVNADQCLNEIKSKLVIKPLARCDSLDLGFLEDKFLLFDITKSLPELSERVLIHDSQLKLKFNHSKGIDVHCYLFNDLFLICKPCRKDRNKMTIFKSPIRLDKFFIKDQFEGAFIALIFNDFLTIDFILEFMAENDEIKLWIDKCNKTRELFLSQFEASLKIPEKLLTLISYKNRQVHENGVCCRENKYKKSDVSVSGYSTGSGDSFLEEPNSDIGNYHSKSIEHQMSVLSHPSLSSCDESSFQSSCQINDAEEKI